MVHLIKHILPRVTAKTLCPVVKRRPDCIGTPFICLPGCISNCWYRPMLIGTSKMAMTSTPNRYSQRNNCFHSLRSIKCGTNAKAGTISAMGPLVIIPQAMAMNAPKKCFHLFVWYQAASCHKLKLTQPISMVSQRTSWVMRNSACDAASTSALSCAISLR